MIPELRLLGGAALFGADGRLLAGGAAQPRRIAVLAVLADAWPAAVTRDRLVGLLWPENDDAGARRLLTQALYATRRELGDVVRASGRDVALDADALRVDLLEFRDAIREGDAERASAAYRGPFLDGLHLRDGAEFERWANGVRDETRRRLQAAVEAMVASQARDGHPRDAARWGERLVETAPFDANAVLGVITLWERAGDRGAALAAAAAYERRMREELELEPDPAVQRRIAELRMLEPATDERRAPAPSPAEGPVPPGIGAPPAAEAPASPPVPPRRPARRWTIAAFAVFAVAGALAALVSRGGAPPAAPRPRVVHLGAFEVRGDARAGASVDAALSAIMLANLDGAGGTRLVRASDGATDPSGAPWATLHGTVVVSGDVVRLDASLRRAGGGSRPTDASVSGPRDSLIALAEQLSLQLVPGLYPELEEIVPTSTAGRFRRVSTLRRRMDGELFLRRGEFDSAYAAFRTATEQDSTLGFVWYRRAVAAELAHRGADADESVAAAERHSTSLPERERLLMRGFRLWRGGDARAAERVFRGLVAAQSRDREAWFQFAELAYHAGPLLGRPIDAARDPWRQLVALDSGNYPALMHAVRLEARAGDTVTVRRLLHRAAAIQATSPAALESRVVAAYGVGDPASVSGILDDLPPWSLDFLHATVAGLLERPAAARAIARRMTRPSEADAVRAEGHVALGTLAMARGRRREAWAELDRAARLNPVSAAWMRAYLATLPFVQLPDSVRDDAARRLAAAIASPAAAPLNQQLAVEAAAAGVVEPYLAAQLRLASGRPVGEGALPCAATLAPSTGALCADLSRGLAAEEARRAGDTGKALRALESIEMLVPYQFAARSVLFARSRERFVHAELLAAFGRHDDAYSRFAAVTAASRLDYLYLAPSHLRRGQLRERAGDRAGAARHFRRAVELWRDADPDIAALRDSAAAGLGRVTGARSSR
jgi:DNA-binding SARP family transcriptional activator